LGPGLERGAQFGFHGGRVEVSADAENDVVGMYVLAVPVEQILTRDCGYRGVFRHAGVGIVSAVRQLHRLALRNFANLIVAAGNAVGFFFLRDVDLVRTKLGILQHVGEDLEHIVEVALEAGPADGCGIGTSAGFDFRRANFEEVVESIAGLRLGATGAPDFAEDVDQSHFADGFVA